MPKLTFINFSYVLLFSLTLAALSFPIMAQVWFDYLMGGHGWRQGDWLINLGSGFVRRGIMGEALILFSDFTSISLLVVVQVLQTFLFVALVFVIWLIGLIHNNRSLLLFLAASPVFFLLFWAGEPSASMRKELFGFLALALLALSSITASRSAFYPILAIVLYSLGTIGNVLHSLMMPTIVAAFYLLFLGEQITRRAFVIYGTITVIMGVLWMGLAILYREIPDLAGVCDPLLARGFEEIFCNDALRWLVTGEVDHLGEVAQRLTITNLTEFAVVAALSIVPIIVSFFVFAERRFLAFLLLIAFVPILPLYAIATDWGRWINIQYTPYVFLLIQAHSVGKLTISRQPQIPIVFALMVASLLISPEVSIGWRPGGAILSLINKTMDFF